MSFHNNPKYQIPELIQALKDHGLDHDKPSQLADAFRLGWVAQFRQPIAEGAAAEVPPAHVRNAATIVRNWHTQMLEGYLLKLEYTRNGCFTNELGEVASLLEAIAATPAAGAGAGGSVGAKPIEIPCANLTAKQAADLTWRISEALMSRGVELWVGVQGTAPEQATTGSGVTDAERYRFIRNRDHFQNSNLIGLKGKALDTMLDASIIDAAKRDAAILSTASPAGEVKA